MGGIPVVVFEVYIDSAAPHVGLITAHFLPLPTVTVLLCFPYS